MWMNPKYAAQYQPPTPPAEQGKRLATLARGDDSEMRINLASFRGRPYVSLRVWERGADGQLWPVKGKGCSLRVNEIGEVIAALRQVEDLAGRPAPLHERPRFVERNRRPQPREYHPHGGPPPAQGFDEFGDQDQ